MNSYDSLRSILVERPRTWLITGGAGFIGSHLAEHLLRLNQRVVSLDDFSTGFRRNLDEVTASVGSEQAQRLTFIEGDIRNLEDCRKSLANVDVVLHNAALGSVPRSLENPIRTNESNVTGFLNMLVAARDAGVKRFVYAASSSTYGDHPDLPKVEDRIGRPMSPYAVTKLVNELYADVFGRAYGMQCIGLRYFNVFGSRQDPNGAYAAVIPKWIAAMIRNEQVVINGDGETSRDFCFVENVVQANLLAALADDPAAGNQVFNVAVGQSTTLNQLFEILRLLLLPRYPRLEGFAPVYRDFRAGDVRHSLADIGKARTMLGFAPTHDLRAGLAVALDWYLRQAEGGHA